VSEVEGWKKGDQLVFARRQGWMVGDEVETNIWLNDLELTITWLNDCRVFTISLGVCSVWPIETKALGRV
jgi:hypothetical protein